MQAAGRGLNTHEKSRALGVVAQACAPAAAAFGIAALLGWLLDLPQLASFEPQWIPMAPSTALLFALFGPAVFLSARFPESAAVRRTSIGVALAAAMLILGLAALYSTGMRTDLEHLGLSIAGSVAGAEIGYMSPVSAAWFMLTAAALIASLSASAPRRTMAGFWLACVVIVVGIFFLLAYLFGRPLLYGGTFIPPAFTTSLAFMALGISLAALAAPRAWKLSDEIDAADQHYARYLIFVFVILGSGLVAVGYFYIKDNEAQYRDGAGRELSAIVDLKAEDLARWRAERLADADVLFRNRAFSELVRRTFGNPQDKRAQIQAQLWLRQVREAYHYDHIILADVRGEARISVPEGAHASGNLAHAGLVMQSGEIAFMDFHRDKSGGAAHLSIVVPILSENGRERLGLLYLGIDPRHYLYPFLQRWPTPSRTAETLLVRREGGDVLVLNELRFQKDAALALHIPLNNTEVPAVKAALGQEGIVEGRDYRGAPVIASVRKVSNSPWFLVAHMDTAEALAPARDKLWLMTGLVGALLLAAAAATGFAWRHRRARHYNERLRASQIVAASMARHRAVTQTATDAIITADAEGRIVGWNPAAARIFGHAAIEILGQPLITLMPERYRERHRLGLARVAAGGAQHLLFKTVELHGLTRAGSEFPLELSLSQWDAAEGVFFTGIIRDIAERKRAEALLAQRNALYNLLSQTNQAIVRITSREELFPQVCRNAVESGRFLFAWIGAISAQNGRVQPVAQYGEDEGYVEAVRISALQSDPTQWSGPLGQALRAGEHVISNDFLNDPRAAPWHEAARRAGVRAAAAFPIREGGRVVGTICLYSAESGFFIEDMYPTLDEMALDVSFALDNYAREAESRRAQEALSESEGRLSAVFHASPIGISVSRIADGRILDINDAALRMYGYARDEVIGRTAAELGLYVDPARREALIARLREFGQVQQVELDYKNRSGAHGKLELTGRVVELQGERCLVAMLVDATERKRLEEVHLQAQKLESLGTLAAGIAHDFNNILAAIRGNADLVAGDVGTDHAAAQSVDEIRKASARASELVRRILAFGRPKEAQQKVVDLGGVVSEVLKLLRSTLPTGISLRKDFAADTPHVLADAGQINEAIVNLTTNAAYAMGSRAGSIEYRLEPVQVGQRLALSIPGIREGLYARLTVTDRGCGMDAAALERIFDAFYTTKPVGEGTGLGLSMVHGTMRSHGGAVTVDSAPGRGSSFALYFPATGEKAVEAEASAPARNLSAAGQRVLYVDDEEALVFLASRALSNLGHQISGFTDPREALEAFRAHPQDFDVVVTDLSMPHMSGLELAREVLALSAGTPVLMTSGYVRAEDEDSARAAGIREVVLKPATMDELGRVLDGLFRQT